MQAFTVGKRHEVLELEAAWKALEDKLGGFPPKRHYEPISGSLCNNTLVWEREWESFYAMEAAYIRLFRAEGLPELRARRIELFTEGEGIEYYFVKKLPE